MPGIDPRFADEETLIKKILSYIDLRQQYSRRDGDESVPEWNEFAATYGMNEYSYKKPA